MNFKQEREKLKKDIIKSNKYCKFEVYSGKNFNDMYVEFFANEVGDYEIARAIIAVNEIQKTLFEKRPELIEIIKKVNYKYKKTEEIEVK